MKRASLNHVFRCVWNATLRIWVVASEKTKAKKKHSLSAAVGVVASSIIGGAQAEARYGPNIQIPPPPPGTSTSRAIDSSTLPTGGSVQYGSVSVSENENSLNIKQSSDRAILNWESFSIGSDASVNFLQNSESSVALNRVLGNDPSLIYGSLTANGQVFLLNSNGITFGKGSRIDVGGLVASTSEISDEDFLSGNYEFSSNGNDKGILNEGSIDAEGGYVALLAPTVENEGVISAMLGTVALAGGEKVTLNIVGNDLISIAVDPGTVNQLIANRHLIRAEGGKVFMLASAAQSLIESAIPIDQAEADILVANEDGSFSLTSQSGSIVAGEVEISSGAGGVTRISGMIDVSSDAIGGHVEITGGEVTLESTTQIDASGRDGGGSVLVGGDFQGANADVLNADNTLVESGATIIADAQVSGDGGRVIVWANDHTEYEGDISVRGGSESGDGGFVEVSGKETLRFNGMVDAGADNGEGGSLLLDPKNITVASGGGAASTDVDQFTDTPAGDSTIDPDTITTITNAGTSITLQANNDITIEDSILSNNMGGNGGTLTFQAGRSISVQATIYSDNGNINFIVNDDAADGGNRDAGNASFQNFGLINAGVGSVTITGDNSVANDLITISTGSVIADNLTITHSETDAGGSITLGGITIGNSGIFNASTGNVNITNTTSDGAVRIQGATTITTSGDVDIQGDSTDIETLQVTANNVTLYDKKSVQLGASVISGNLLLDIVGPIGNTGIVTVVGDAFITTTDGGFGISNSDINLGNFANDFNRVIVDQDSTGAVATFRDANNIIIGGTVADDLTITTAGDMRDFTDAELAAFVDPVFSSGRTVDVSAVGPLTSISNSMFLTLNSGATGNITFDHASNDFGQITISNANNVVINDVDDVAIYNTNVQGSYSLTAGSTIRFDDSDTIVVGAGFTVHNTSGNIYSDNYVDFTVGGNFSITSDLGAFYTGYDSDITVNDGNLTISAASTITFGEDANIDVNDVDISGTDGNLDFTAGGTISQNGSVTDDGTITVDGTSDFTVTAATSDLLVGENGNNFAGTVTMDATGLGTYRDVNFRNANAGNAVLSGLESAGTLRNVTLYFDNATSLNLPGMTITQNLIVDVPNGAVTQANELVVAGDTYFDVNLAGNITLTHGDNDFNDFIVEQANDVTVVDKDDLNFYAYYDVNTWRGTDIGGSLTVTAGGDVTQTNNPYGIRVDGLASFTLGANNLVLNNTSYNQWNQLQFVSANNVLLHTETDIQILTSTVSGTFELISGATSLDITQGGGTTLTTTGNTTFRYFDNITLANSGNRLGDLYIDDNNSSSYSGTTSITENDAITQYAGWETFYDSIVLHTENDQGITLTQTSNNFGNIIITQTNSGAASAGAVSINENNHITQGGAWTTHGNTAISTTSRAYDVTLTNTSNVLGDLQISADDVYINENDTIGDFAAWTTDITTLNAYALGVSGNGNIVLNEAGNVMGDLQLTAQNATITENHAITDYVTQWNTPGTVILNAGTAAITLDDIDNILGDIDINGSPSSVLITENHDITQSGAWAVGTAPVTLNSRANDILITESGNTMGGITITTVDGTPSSVTITENSTITQASAWVIAGVPVTLNAENNNAITLTNSSNIMGNLIVTGGAVNITEADSITDGAAWTTTGTTTLNAGSTGSTSIILDNASHVLGDLAFGGIPQAVTITENDSITQASAWSLGNTPIVLAVSDNNDITLNQTNNVLGTLDLTAGGTGNVTVVDTNAITDSGEWTVGGIATLTANNGGTLQDIVLDAAGPAGTIGTLRVVEAANVDASVDVNTLQVDSATNVTLTDADEVDINTSFVTTLFEIDAGGAITQSGAISSNQLLLVGSGYATLTNAGNNVTNLAAAFTGGDLRYTDANDFAVATVSGTNGIGIGANNITLTSIAGTVTGLPDISNSSASLTINTGTALVLPNMVIDGAQDYTAGGSGITLSSSVQSTSLGAISFHSNVTASADLTIQSTNSNISFDGTLDGGGNILTINAGAGTNTFTGVVSNMGSAGDAQTALNLTAGGTGSTFLSTLSANNGITGTGSVVFRDNVTLSDGTVGSTFAGQVTLGKVGGMNLSGYDTLRFSGGVVLENGAAEINSNNSLLTFENNAIQGPYDLVLNSGNAQLYGLELVNPDLTSLDVTAQLLTIEASGLVINGAQTFTATNGTNIRLLGNVQSTAAGAITFNSAVDMGASVTPARAVTSVDSAINFNGAVDGALDLTVNSGTATTTFAGAVGSTTAIGDGTGASLILQGSGSTVFSSTLDARSGMTSVGGVMFSDNVTLANGDTASSLGGTVIFDGITFDGYDGLTVAGAATLSTGAVTINTNGGNLELQSTIDGAQDLTVNAGTGAVTFTGAVGGVTDIGDGTGAAISVASSGAVGFQSTVEANSGIVVSDATGSVSFQNDVTLANGDTASNFSGDVVFDGLTFSGFDGLTIGGNTTLSTAAVILNTNNGAVDFTGTTDGSQDLTVNAGSGAVTFTGAVGSGLGTELGDGTGAAITVATSGPVEFASTVEANSGLVVSNAAGDTILRGDVTLANGDTGSNFAGTVTLDGLTFTGFDGFNIDGAVTLASAAVSVDSNGGALNFGSTINGAQDLTLAADAGSISVTGAVGQTTALNNITINAADAVTFNAPVTSASFNQAVTGTGAFTLGGLLTAETGVVALDALSLDLNGGIITYGQLMDLNAGVGGIDLAAGQSVTTTATANSGATSGAVDIDSVGGVNLAGDINTQGASHIVTTGSHGGAVTVDVSGGASTITLAGDITTSGGATTDANADGGNAGNISFNTASGNINIQNSTMTGAGGIPAGFGNQGAGANVTFSDPVVLQTGATSISTGASSGNILFTGTVDGTQNLTLSAGTGNIDFDAAVGNSSALSALTINSAANTTLDSTLDAASFTQTAGTGTTTFSGVSTLSGAFDYTGQNLTVNAAINSAGTTEVTQAGTFTTSASGDISADAGFVQNGTGTNSLAGDVVTANNGISFATGISLAGDLLMNSGAGAGNIMLSSTVDGGQNLSLTAGTGGVTLGANVGSSTKLASLNASAANISLNNVDTTGTQTYTASGAITTNSSYSSEGGAINFAGNVIAEDVLTVNTTANAAAGASITFGGTLNSANTETNNVTLTAGTGNIDFDGAVGATDALNDLLVNSAANVTADSTLNAFSYTQNAGSGTTTLSGATTLGNNFSFTGQHLTVNAALGTTNTTSVVNAGTFTTGALGDINAGAGFSQTGTGTNTLAGDITTTNDDIGFATAITLTGDVALNTGAGIGGVTLGSTVDGGQALTVTAGTGDATLSGNLGASTALASASVSGANVNLHDVTTSGAQTYTATGGITTNSTYLSEGGAITFAGNLIVEDALIVNTTANANAGAAIAFNGTVNSATLETNAVTLTAGIGNIDFDAAWGATDALGAVAINSAANLTLDSTFNGASLVQSAGTGTTTFVDNLTTSGIAGVNITNTNIVLDGLTVNAETGNGVVRMAGVTTLNNDLIITRGTGAVTFASTLDSQVAEANSLTINGTGSGSVAFTGAVGNNVALGTVLIQSATAITAGSSIDAANLGLEASSDVTLTDAGNDVDILAATLSSNAALSFVDADGLTIGDVGTLSGLNDGAGTSNVSLTVNGLLNQSVGSLISLAGNLTIDTSAFNAGNVSVTNADVGGTELGNSFVSGDFTLDSAGDITQSAGAYLRVGGNFNTPTGTFVEGDTSDNFFAGGGGISADNEIRLNGVITLEMVGNDLRATDHNANVQTVVEADLAGGVLVVSDAGGESITPAADVSAVMLTENNLITGALSIITDGTYTSGGATNETGILQSSALNLPGNISLVVQESAANTDGSIVAGEGLFVLDNAANVFAGSVSVDAENMDVQLAGEGAGASAIQLGNVKAGQFLLDITQGATQAANTAIRANELVVRGAGATLLDGANRIDDFAANVSDAFTLNIGATYTGAATTEVITINPFDAGGAVVGLTTSDDAINISSGIDLDITNAINSGAAQTSITATNNLNINLCSAASTCNPGLTISNTELALVSAGATRFITQNNQDIYLSGVTEAGTANTGLIELVSADAIDFATLAGAVSPADNLFTSGVNATAVGSVNVGTNRSIETNGAALNLTGAQVNLNNGSTLNSEGGSQTLTGSVQVGGTVLLTSGAGAGDISIVNSVDGAADLSVTAGTGNIDFQSDLGATTGLSSMTASAANIALNNVSTSGNQSYTAATGITTNNSNYVTQGGSVAFAGNLTLNNAMTVDTTNSGANAAGANITFTGTVNSQASEANALTLTAGTAGNVDMQGNAGQGINGELGAVQIVSANQVDMQNIVAGSLSVMATNIDLNSTTYDANTGAISLNGTVDLDLGAATASLTTANQNITLGNVSDAGSDSALSLNAGSGVLAASGVSGVTTLTVTQTGGASFSSNVAATTVTLTDTTGAIVFNGDLTADTLNTAAQDYSVSLLGGATVTNDATLLNTGAVTLGNAATDTTTFTGGLDTTAASATNVAGTLATTNTQMDLGAVTLGADTALTSGSGAINIASVTDGASSYSLDLGNGTQTGAITVSGNLTVSDLDTFTSAYDLILNGSSNTVDTDTTLLNTGAVTLGDAGTDSSIFAGGLDTTAASVTNVAGSVATTNTQMDLGAVTLGADTALTSGSAAINIASATDGASSYSLDLGDGTQTGVVTINGNLTVSDLDTFASAYDLTLNGASNTVDTDTTLLNTGAVTLGDADTDSSTFAGGLDITAASSASLAGTIATTDAQLDIGTVTLTADTTLATGTADLSLNSTVNGAFNLALNSSGITTLNGILGGVSELVSLTTNAGGTTEIGGSQLSFSGALTFNDAVTVNTGTALTAGSITTGSTLSAGVNNLTLTTDALSLGGNVTGSGDLIIENETAAATIGLASGAGTLNLDATEFGYLQDGFNSITFGNVNSGAITLGAGSVSLADTTILNSAGAVNASGSLVLNGDYLQVNAGASSELSGSVSGTGDLQTIGAGELNLAAANTYSGQTTIGAGASLSVTNTSALQGTSNVANSGNLDVSGATNVTIASVAGSGDVNLGGESLTLSNNSGEISGVISGTGGSLALGGGSLTLSGINTYTGSTSVNGGTLTVTNNAALGTADAGTTVADGATLLLDGSGSNLTIADDLTLAGTGNAGAGAIRNLTGDNTLNGNVTLTGDTQIEAAAGGMRFNGAIDASIDGASALTINSSGAVSLTGAVGGTTALTSLTTDAGGSTSLANVTTTGIQNYGDNVSLGGSYTATDANINVDGTATLAGATDINSGSGNVTFTGAVNGPQTLAVNSSGTTTFSSDVGGSTALTSLTTDAGGDVSLQNVTTTGAQSYGDNASLAGTYTTTNANVSVGGATTLAGATNVNVGSGGVSFTGTVDGAQTLAVNSSGSTTFSGDVGGTTALTSLSTDAGGNVSLQNVTTTGAQNYADNATLNGAYTTTNANLTVGGATTLAGATNVNVGSGNASFTGAVDGAQTLAVNSSGTTTFTGDVGATTALTSLSTDADGNVSLQNVTTTGTQNYADNATLNGTYTTTNSNLSVGGDTSLAGATSVNVGSGNATFTGTVDGAQTLAINSSGSTIFNSELGGTTALTSLTTDAGGSVSAQSVTTSGAQSYGEDATLSGTYTTTNANLSVDGTTTLAGATSINTGSGNATFTGAVDGAATLALNGSGSTTFSSNVGETTALTSVTTNAGGDVSLQNVTTTGAQSYGNNATLNGSYTTTNASFDVAGNTGLAGDTSITTGSGDIAFDGTINGSQSLQASTTGAVNLAGVVGGTTALTSVDLAGGSISVSDVDTTGTQTYTASTIATNSTYRSDGSAITFDGDMTINGELIVDTTNNASAGANVQVTGTLNSQASEANNVTVTAGTGAVEFAGDMGTATNGQLGNLLITSASQTDLASVTAASINITANNIDLNGTGYQAFSGEITFAGNLDLDAGSVTTAINTNNQNITFENSVTSASSGATLAVNAGSGNVEGQGALSFSNLNVTGGTVTFNHSGNAISAVTASVGAGGLSLRNSATLTVAAGGVTSSAGDIDLRNSAGNMVLDGAVTSTGAGDILIASTDNFINNAGASALQTNTGRWLVYSSNPGLDTRGGLTPDFKHYNANLFTVLPGATNGRNGFIYEVSPQITVTLTGSVGRVYDSTTNAVLTSANYDATTGAIDGDVITLNYPVNGTFDTKNVGEGKNITVNGLQIVSVSEGSADVYGYTLTSTSAVGDIGTITAADLIVSGLVAFDKEYDGTTTAQISTAAASAVGVIGSDDIAFISASGVFDSVDAGTGIGVIATDILLSGSDRNNYQLVPVTGLSAAITPKELTLSASAVDRAYNGTVLATNQVSLTADLITGDDVNFTFNAAYLDSSAGQNKFIDVTDILISGTDAANYRVTSNTQAFADILPEQLTVYVNNDARFVTETDTVGYNGVSYAGFVNGENTNVLSGNLVITRTGNQSTAGSYTDVLVASGLDTDNYHIVYEPGDYQIVGADTLLVRMDNASVTYGETPSYQVADARYLDGGSNNIVDLTSMITVTGNSLSLNDSTGGTASLTLSLLNTTNSSAGEINAGSYVVEAANIQSDSANFSDVSLIGNLSVTPRAVTVSGITAASRVYDGTTDAELDTSGAVFNNIILGDDLSLVSYAEFEDKNAGADKQVIITSEYSGIDLDNYFITDQATALATITPRSLTVAGVTADDRIYDGTTSVSLNTDNITYTGLVEGDIVALSVTGAFRDRNVGNNRLVDLTNTYTGADVNNYAISSQLTTTAGITPRSLFLSGSAGEDRTYNGTNVLAAGLGYGELLGVLVDDEVSIVGFAEYDSANAGARTIEQGTVALNGGDSGNYSLHWIDGSGTITPADLTVVVGNDAKFVSEADTAGYNGATYLGFVNGESIADLDGSLAINRVNSEINAAGVYGDVLVASGLTSTNYAIQYVAGDYSIVGADELLISFNNTAHAYGDAANYVVTEARYLDSSDSSIIDLTGNVVVNGNRVSLTDGFGGSASFELTPMSAQFSNAGELQVGNYDLGAINVAVTSANFDSDITVVGGQTVTPRSVFISSVTAEDRIYDGTTAATISLVDTGGLLAGDLVDVNFSGVFATRNVGTDLEVLLVGEFSGVDLHNYRIDAVSTTTADILARHLTIRGITAEDRVYDGTRDATVVTTDMVLDGLVIGDDVNVGATGGFASRNASADIRVDLDLNYSGNDVGNYIITDQASTSATITQRQLTLSGIEAIDRVYDGTTAVEVDGSRAIWDGLVAGDDLNLSVTGTLETKDAGVDRTVILSSAYTGADLDNYLITNQLTSTATISQREITVTGLVAEDRIYDGTTNASVDVSLANFEGLISGDDIRVTSTGEFETRNVGNDLYVALTNSYSGSDVANYHFVNQVSSSADISQRALTVTNVIADDKIYDGTTAVTINPELANITGLIDGDDVTIELFGEFSSSHVGVDIDVLLDGRFTGSDASNYIVSSDSVSRASITPRTILVSGITAADKLFDGSTSATLDLSQMTMEGLIEGDDVTLGAAGYFANANTGVERRVMITTHLSGNDLNNYIVVAQDQAYADILPGVYTQGSRDIAAVVEAAFPVRTISSIGAETAIEQNDEQHQFAVSTPMDYTLADTQEPIKLSVAEYAPVSSLVSMNKHDGFISVKHFNPLTVKGNQPFVINLPEDTFTHAGQYTVEAQLVDGSPLPQWLEFNAKELQIYGVAPDNKTLIEIVFIARDSLGNVVTSKMEITLLAIENGMTLVSNM
ncbi:YDG domain-containing protein [Teredinibacter sp. KSP-S5-2]|nr:YDG domain-containing protein [Teredinibacter sp. KSP-S5-2]WNO07824.1 YDG domain-containing protein [Teredinibacter sp. KSP-S5-2]